MNLLTSRTRNDDGMTLIELVVGMFVMGLISMLIFNVFQSTNQTAQTVQSGTTDLASVQLAHDRLSKDIRTAASFNISQDGHTLTLVNFEDEEVVWHSTESGLDNGSYVHEPITVAEFSYVDGLIEAHLKAGSTDVIVGGAPRVKPEGGVVNTGAGIIAGSWTSEGDDGTLAIH